MVRSVLREAEKKELPTDGFNKAGQGQVINKSLAAGHTRRFSHPLYARERRPLEECSFVQNLLQDGVDHLQGFILHQNNVVRVHVLV